MFILHIIDLVPIAQRLALEGEVARLGAELAMAEQKLHHAETDGRAQVEEAEKKIQHDAAVVEERLKKTIANLEEQLEKASAARDTLNEVR